jgi:F-type H+-transporting ATPase subunit epsilon
MTLKLLLPFRVFAEQTDVRRIAVDTCQGSLGLLPHRLDCVVALVPGILTYETSANGEQYVAVDAGILVKAGPNVLVSVRNAVGGTDLGRLREAVDREFRGVNEREKSVRAVLARLEAGFIRRFAALHHE